MAPRSPCFTAGVEFEKKLYTNNKLGENMEANAAERQMQEESDLRLAQQLQDEAQADIDAQEARDLQLAQELSRAEIHEVQEHRGEEAQEEAQEGAQEGAQEDDQRHLREKRRRVSLTDGNTTAKLPVASAADSSDNEDEWESVPLAVRRKPRVRPQFVPANFYTKVEIHNKCKRVRWVVSLKVSKFVLCLFVRVLV